MKPWIIVLLSCLAVSIKAQNFQGNAFYKFNNSYAKVDWESKKKMGANEMASLKAELSQASRKTYQLSFTLQESSWAKVEELAIGGGKGDKAGWGKAKDKLLYKNLSEQSYQLETEAFDKLFLVSGLLELPTWEITGESKQIGKYNAQKAIYKQEEKVMVFGKPEPETKVKLVEAWFTTQIPISSGPEYYWGLPGLILEIRNGNESYTCERIELNTTGEFNLGKPKRGQQVNAEQLQNIIDQKTQEMYQRYNKKGKKG